MGNCGGNVALFRVCLAKSCLLETVLDLLLLLLRR